MNDDPFEWDEEKAAQNYADHGVTFALVMAGLNDP